MSVQYLKRDGLPSLAYVFTDGDGPLVVFLGGYKSDMQGTKAHYLEEQAKNKHQAFLRFDYSGHGQSEGEFAQGTVGLWAKDACDVIEHVRGQKEIILVGSSMGGWIAMLLCTKFGLQPAGVIGIAAAPDFTKELFEKKLNEEQRQAIMNEGLVKIPNDYSDEPYIFTKALLEDGEENSVLGQGLEINSPIHLIQGKQDMDVHWQTAERVKKHFNNVEITYIEDGDHRLSRPEDLSALDRLVARYSYSK